MKPPRLAQAAHKVYQWFLCIISSEPLNNRGRYTSRLYRPVSEGLGDLPEVTKQLLVRPQVGFWVYFYSTCTLLLIIRDLSALFLLGTLAGKKILFMRRWVGRNSDPCYNLLNPEDTLLTEISRPSQYWWFHLSEVPTVVTFILTEWWVPGSGRGREDDIRFNRDRVSVFQDEKILEMDDGEGCTTMSM